MFRDVFEGFDIRKYHGNVQRFFLFGIPFFSGMGLFFLLYNLYLLRLGFREDFIGWLVGMTPLASGLFAIPIGIWSDRIGRKPFLIAAALLMGLSQLGLCLSHNPLLLLCFAFLGGISPSLIFVNHVPFLAENCPPNIRGQAMAIAIGIQAATRMLVSLVGGALPRLLGLLAGVSTDRPEPFRYALLLGAGVTLLSTFPLFGILPDRSRESERASRPGAEVAVKPPWRLLMVFMTISALRGLSFGLTMPFFNVFYQERLHASAAAIGAIFFFSQAVGLPSTIAAPALCRRFGARATIVLFRVLAALCLGVMGGLEGLVVGVVVFLVLSVAEGVSTPAEMSFVTDMVSRPYWGRMQSLRVTGYQLFSALGSAWAGEMILRLGYGPTFGAGGLAILASGATFLVCFGRRPPGDSKGSRCADNNI